MESRYTACVDGRPPEREVECRQTRPPEFGLNVDFVVAIQDRQRMKLGERHAPHPKRTHYSACGLVDDNIYTARRFAPDEGFDVCQRGIFEV